MALIDDIPVELTAPALGDKILMRDIDDSTDPNKWMSMQTLSALSLVAATSWTPAMAFGGATTGITYTTQYGSIVKIGPIAFAFGHILLSSKGSATGSATVTGLTYTSTNASASFRSPADVYASPLTLTGVPHISIANNATSISLLYTNAGVENALADTHFQNTTRVYFMLAYLTA